MIDTAYIFMYHLLALVFIKFVANENVYCIQIPISESYVKLDGSACIAVTTTVKFFNKCVENNK
jgi:hypothetical protein